MKNHKQPGDPGAPPKENPQKPPFEPSGRPDEWGRMPGDPGYIDPNTPYSYYPGNPRWG
jgi:hypothetical protein